MKYIKLLRVKHYLKNILLFLPLVFSGLFFKGNNFWITIIGFVSFSIMASAIYIINDINDYEYDKLHEIKKHRAIASGEVSVKLAKIICIFLIFISLIITFVISKNILLSTIWITIYLVLNIFYSIKMKNIPIIDVSILTFGFVLRVLYGGSLTNISVSSWLLLTILTASFYMSLGKRRGELNKNGNKTRKVLSFYSLDFLDKNMYLFLALSLVFYSLWTINTLEKMIITVPIIFVICLRYNLILSTKKSFGDPVDIIFSDKILIFLILAVGLIVFITIYFPLIIGWL